jgi:2-oxoglutarate dehydrogenase complex dehydrogenase (E1) component-like enzyme
LECRLPRYSDGLTQDNDLVSKAVRLRLLVDAYRLYGHQFADTDPLHYTTHKHGALDKKVLDYKSYGFTEADMDL